jgi:hypothetical protein
MLARVSMFEGGTAEGIRAAAEQMRTRIAEGPPPGIRGSGGVTVLVDPDGGRVMAIALFGSQEDLRASESTLQQMSPPEGMGTQTSVDVYEVAAEVRR